MFYPFQVGELRLANRVVVSPMAQYSAVDGLPNDWHLVHLGSRAVGGAGLVMTEMTCVSPEGRITLGCTGLWNGEQQSAWARIVDFVHQHSHAKIGLQLGHSGRKGSCIVPWEGDDDQPLASGGWPVMAPSALPYRPAVPAPHAMTRADMDRVRDQFVAAATAWARGPASTCWSCTTPMATCCPASSRRSPTAATTAGAAISRAACAIRSRCWTRCGRPGRPGGRLGADLGHRLGRGRHRRR